MANTSSTREKHIRALRLEIEKLQLKLAKIATLPPPPTPLTVHVAKSQKRFTKVHNPDGPDIGMGEFFLLIDVTALTDTIYIPLSIASGKKPTGFVYQIEGTAQGVIRTTDITATGTGVTKVTLGTLHYVKIPKGTKATFRILIEIKGQMQHSYHIVISRINYKLNPSDARYKQFSEEIHSPTLAMRS